MNGEILTITAAEYHGDPAPTPSLSSSIAAILCTASPLHAWTAHPRLNPDYQPTEKTAYDVGTVAHALLLQGEDVAVIGEFPDWRTNAAKDFRDAARAAGQVPLLTKDWDAVQAMVAAANLQLDRHEASPRLFTAGKPEQTITWEEDGVWLRSRLDWLHDDYRAVDDLKTTSRSANPAAYAKALSGVGADLQAAMYLRAVKTVTGEDAEFRWCVVETSPPYGLSVVSPGTDVLALAESKLQYAIDLWRGCLESGEWPGYTNRVAYAELPGWAQSQWLEKEAMEEAA